MVTRRNERSRVQVIMLLLAAACSQPARAQVTSTWNGTTGSWTNAARWSTNPLFPNNGNGGQDYNAIINSGTVTLDQDITIEDLSFNGGTITGANSLTLNDTLSWTAGTFAGTGTTTITNGTISSFSPKTLNDRTLEILGTLELTQPLDSTSRGTFVVRNGAEFITSGAGGFREVFANVTIDEGGLLTNSGSQFTGIRGNVVNNGAIAVQGVSALSMTGGSGSGDIYVGQGAAAFFELDDADDYQFTGRIILDGGIFDILVFGGGGIQFLLPSYLSGNGTFNANGGTLVNSTEISPGFSVGHLDIDADYVQTPEGKVIIEVEGANPGQYDTLAITGTANLGGTLEVIVTDESQLPPGTMISIITAKDTLGTEFDDFLTIGAEDIFLAPVYADDEIALLSFADGDMDRMGDGVTLDDVDDFALALTNPHVYRFGSFPGDPSAHGISAHIAGDIDDDGDCDVDDIDDFADLVGLSVAELIERMNRVSIPEPATAWLLTLGFMAAVGRRK